MKEKLKDVIDAIIRDLQRIKVAIVILVIYVVVTQFLFGTICPMRIVFGYPCPGCGLTRGAFKLIFGLNIKEAWACNPTIFLWMTYIMIWLGHRYILKTPIKKNNLWLVLIGLITIVCYILRIFDLIPYSALDKYQKNNIFIGFIETIFKIL